MVLTPDHGTVLWALRSRGDEVTAFVRLHALGQELVFLWNGSEYLSQMFKDADSVLAAAREKRDELEANGWRENSASSGVKG